jgi:catecholate siderophore receptor
MKLNFMFTSLAALLAAGLTAPAAFAAPPSSAVVQGTVVDSTDAAIPGAEVQLVAGEATRKTVTDAAGRFSFADVPPGPARVTVTFPGFAPFEAGSIDRAKALAVVLAPEGRAEQVTVRSSRMTVERVSSATRTDTPLRDVPQSVTVVTRELIEDQKMRGMADVVRYVPGVGIAQGEGNRDTPVLRGNSSTGDFFVDGIRDDVQYFRDLYNVERVEVLKGPNAMTFGRGGVGGVINRVPRRADGSRVREITIQGGSWSERRATMDVGDRFGRLDARVTAVYEDSGSYRDGVGLGRYGVNPTFKFALGPWTMLRAGYEHFHDDRTADRGIPSFQGRPLPGDPAAFFGSADRSLAAVTLDAFSATLERRTARLRVRNHTRYAVYDKFYQNVFPGAVNAAGTQVALTAYNNATDRRNVFNQTDVVFQTHTGPLAHTLVVGGELGRQATDNFRNTGYFTSLGPNATSLTVPLGAPTTSLPIEFRQSATDADNDGVATVAAVYAQDQVAIADRLHVVAGVRYDRFAVDFRNRRTGIGVESTDRRVSPRVGLVVKPWRPLSLYASHTRAFLPRAGEQLSSLSPANRALDPEEFRSDEIGAKWDLEWMSFTAAAYRLDRGNVAVPDPVDPAISHLVDGQRTKGLELGAAGHPTRAWTIVAGYAYQDGEILSSLSPTAPAGARLAQLPAHSFAVWNRYELSRRWGVGLGVIHRGDVFTSTDNKVVVPALTRVDGALFGTFRRLRGQVNVENLLDAAYYPYAHSNDNITPGAPRTVRLSLTARF